MNVELMSYNKNQGNLASNEMGFNSHIKNMVKNDIVNIIPQIKTPAYRRFLSNMLNQSKLDMITINKEFAQFQSAHRLFNNEKSPLLKKQLLSLNSYFLIADINTMIAIVNFVQDVNDTLDFGNQTLVVPEVDSNGNLISHNHNYTNKMVNFIRSIGIHVIIQGKNSTLEKAVKFFNPASPIIESVSNSNEYRVTKNNYDDDSFVNGSSFDCSVNYENEFENWY